MTKLITVVALLAVGGTAFAQAKPLRADSGVQATNQAGWNGANGVPGLYYKTGSGWWVRKPDNSETGPLGTGGGSSTLDAVYAAGSGQSNSTFTLDSTRLGLRILDAGTTINTLFTVANNAASTNYFQLTTNAQQLVKGAMADGASAVGLGVDTTSTWANATSKPFRVLTGGSERFSVTGPGNLNLVANASVLAASAATNTTGLTIKSNVADGASSVGIVFDNAAALSTAGYRSFSFRNNGTEDWYMSRDSGTYPRFNGTNSTASEFAINDTIKFSMNSTGVKFFSEAFPDSAGSQTLGDTTNYWSTTVSRHFSGAGTAPTKAAGACIGGTQTVTLDANASDASGNITMTSTATGTASATCATVTFNTAYATAPHCSITPSNAAASALSGAAALYIDSASTTTALFVIKVGGTALVTGTYIYTYDCVQ